MAFANFFRHVLAFHFLSHQVCDGALGRVKGRQASSSMELMTSLPTLNAGQFAPAKWNMYSEEGPRTNNTLEGWHS